MRIPEVYGTIGIAPNKEMQNPLGDMGHMFGGYVEKASPMDRLDGMRRVLKGDVPVTAGEIGRRWGRQGADTVVRFGNLEVPEHALCLTATLAYVHRGYAHPERQLVMEVPGTYGDQEFNERFGENGLHVADGRVISGRDFYSRAWEDGPSGRTTFHARGVDLPAAAQVMADGYDALLFHDDDASAAVAGALGVPNLPEFDQTWQKAMAQPTPLAAGQLILRSFS